MKLQPINHGVVRYNPSHPLHSLLMQCEELNCDDPQEVQGFFEKMTVPQGYFAMVLTGSGYWIEFFEPVQNQQDMEYVIYHPHGGALNHKCERGVYEYNEVGYVTATSLSEAFMKSQNDLCDESSDDSYLYLGVRSTSVGDIIRKGDTYYMITGTGFVEVPPTVVQYIDWGNHMYEKDPTDLYNDQDYA